MNLKKASPTMSVLDKRWRTAASLIFGQDVGSLEEYSEWLLEQTEPLLHQISSVSGIPVTYVIPDYGKNSRWISFGEVDFNKRFSQLSINEVKDIDSLAEALADRFYYAGNLILGNSGNVERCANITDTYFALESGRIGDSKYIAYSTMGRLNEDMFGCNAIGESAFCIKCHDTTRNKRCFELWSGQNCSDCYYSYGLASCSNCIFCFHIKNKTHAIGNLKLDFGKYNELKKKLLAEMAEELKKKKRLPSLVEIVEKSKAVRPALPLAKENNAVFQDKRPVEEAFSNTCKLVLGSALRGGVDGYSEWLMRHVPKMEKCCSVLSGREMHRSDFGNYFDLPGDRLIAPEEAPLLGEYAKLGADEIEHLSFANIQEFIGKIAFFAPTFEYGTSSNIMECATGGDSSNCYRTQAYMHSQYCAYSFWPRSSGYAFGCRQVFDSEFCINCYYSVKLRRCFEMDSCRDCSDSYFCHNCENVHDSMFCFNAKNLRYAVGNAEVGREKFLELKAKLLGRVNGELAKTHGLAIDIYNIGSRK